MTTIKYGSAALYATYATERGWPASTIPADTADTDAALLVASEYLDGRYRSSFTGYPTGGRAQDREWPRTSAYAMSVGVSSGVPGYRTTGQNQYYPLGTTEIPKEVLNATYEIARRQIANPGSLRTDFTLAKSYKSVSVTGAVAVTYVGADSAADAQLSIAGLDAILQPLMAGSGQFSSLSGKVKRV